MGMSTHIVAYIRDDDPTFQKHKKVLLACLEADVSLPKETALYFESEEPYMSLLDERLEVNLKYNLHYTDYRNDMMEGFEVDLEKLPKGVSKLRFVNSY